MPKLKEIVNINNEIVFGGAVQSDWFYDKRADEVASNFVFHGKDYFGVTYNDIDYKDHKLIDTATYTKIIADKLYYECENPFILSIAGYGTGKSHLAVTLGKLFSQYKNNEVSQIIIKNLKKADIKIGEEIDSLIKKPNLVIVINGMKDFNLNYEILSISKKILNNYGYDETIFSEFTQAYNIAKNFVQINFDNFQDLFIEEANKKGIKTDNYKNYLIDNILKDEVFDSVNNVYKEKLGVYIRWDEGISAGEVLKRLNDKLCGENKPFNKILILFDEFGRYIEYASEYPNRAGDSSLQQIFEAVQNSEKNIIFVGFIQADLKTYIARVNKISNVSRYIGRYEIGEKIYLSSNLETIFANIIDKSNGDSFNYYINNRFNSDEVKNDNYKLYSKLKSWSNDIEHRGVWNDWNKFEQVIVKGIYPLHPISTLLITSLSDWYQQRSAINFLIDSYKNIQDMDVNEYGDLPKIYPTDIIKGDFFKELLLAENENRKKSEYCIMFDKILIKYQEKLSKIDIDLLASILVSKLLKFKYNSREDVILSLHYITDLNEKIIDQRLLEIEEEYGFIQYDSKLNIYDFVIDAAGLNDFNRIVKSKLISIKGYSIENLLNYEIKEKLNLSDRIDTEFRIKNSIETTEWMFEQDIIPINNIDEKFILNYIKEFKSLILPDKPKGRVYYLYYNSDMNLNIINEILEFYHRHNLDNYPIILHLLDDSDNDFKNSLLKEHVIKLFDESEKAKYERFINKFVLDNEVNLKNIFRELVSKRQVFSKNGIVVYDTRLNKLCSNVFDKIYKCAISFPFDGFASKTFTPAKKMYSIICKSILSNALNEQWVLAQNKETINRIDSVLKNNIIGWGALNDDYKLIQPRNNVVRQIFLEINELLEKNGIINLGELYGKYLYPPYGCNAYSFSLLMCLFINNEGELTRLKLNNKVLKTFNWATDVFLDKELNLKDIYDTEMFRVNIDDVVNKYHKICEEILNNIDIDLVVELNDRFYRLLDESEVPEQFINKVEICRIRLKEGLSLREQAEKKLGLLRADYEEGIEQKRFDKLINIILGLSEFKKVIHESYGYEYSNRQLLEIKKIFSNSKKFIQNHYEEYITSLKCPFFDDLNSFTNRLSKMMRNLQKLSMHSFAELTRKKIEEENDRLNKIRDIAVIEESIINYVNTFSISQYSSQDDLISNKSKIDTFVDNLNKNMYLDKYHKQHLLSLLKPKLDKINKLLEEIEAQITLVLDEATVVSDREKARELLQKAEDLLSKKISNKDSRFIRSICNILHNLLNDLKLVDNTDDFKGKIDRIKELKQVYESKGYDEEVSIDLILRDEINKINLMIDNLNEKWAENHLNYSIDDIQQWDSRQCLTWKSSIQNYPDYLFKKHINKALELKTYVDERLSELNIDAVLELFDKLTNDEKKKCIKKIKEIYLDNNG